MSEPKFKVGDKVKLHSFDFQHMSLIVLESFEVIITGVSLSVGVMGVYIYQVEGCGTVVNKKTGKSHTATNWGGFPEVAFATP